MGNPPNRCSSVEAVGQRGRRTDEGLESKNPSLVESRNECEHDIVLQGEINVLTYCHFAKKM